jgi:hypothetical protein
MFESVFDYPYLSSSANHIFDITSGYSSTSTLSGASNTQNSKKINIYNQMAQVLMGYDETGGVRLFDEDGDIIAGGTKINECYFINFARILTKDEIKKGTFELELVTSDGFAHGADSSERIKITDASGSDGYFVNSPAGEYGVLFATGSAGANVTAADQSYRVGLLFYQAGVAVISGSVFSDAADGGILNNAKGTVTFSPAGGGVTGFNTITGSTIEVMAQNLRNRTYNMQFNNTTELNSTIYFCRANNTEFNYSANPTYLSTSNGPSEIVVKDGDPANSPVSYVTSVGLYSPDNELLAVAKVSEPLKKDPSNELTLRVRLDY